MKIKRKNILIICIALLAISTSVFSNQDSKTITQENLSKPHKPPILTTAAIIEVYDSDNQFQGIVLIERGKAPWGKALPGGKVEYGETVENAIRREMMEEVNLELFDLKQFHVYSDPTRDFRHHSVEVTYFAKAYKYPKAGDDAAKAFVVKVKDIPWETLAFDHAKILKDYLKWKNDPINNELLYKSLEEKDMENICIKIKLKPNALSDVRNWFKELKNRKSELLDTLVKEGVFVESVYLDQVEKDYFLIYYMKALNIKKAMEVFQNSTLDIDNFHKEQWEKCCLETTQLENLLDIDQIKK